MTAIFAVGMAACSDRFEPTASIDNPEDTPKEEGMERVVASSSAEIYDLIESMGEPGSPQTRTVLNNVNYSNNEETFQSLVEANRQKVMSSLSQAQLDSIRNDEDELEFCPDDSVIADIRFAQLLNADREIQVKDTVYRYFPNGIAYTGSKTAGQLKTIEPKVASVKVDSYPESTTIQLTKDVMFKPVHFQQYVTPIEIGGGTTYPSNPRPDITATSDRDGIHLNNGITIPTSEIRDVDYDTSGDGNWLHYVWTRAWGRNIVALKKIAKRRQLNLNFYDQNYLIYANIGTKLKMQKKVCGIWWNIKAQELVQGWESVTVKYTYPTPITPSTFSLPGMKNPSISTNWQPFPFSKNVVLLKIPFTDFNFTTYDLNKAFKSAALKAFNEASDYVKGQAKKADNLTLACFKDENTAFFIHGPFSEGKHDARSMESKFHTKWFPGTVNFVFSLGNTINLKSIKFGKNDGVELDCGVVFGAIKYKDKWYGARITKKHKDKK